MNQQAIEKGNVFGNLEPVMCKRIDIINRITGDTILTYYNRDLNEVVKLTYNRYFIDRIPVKVVADNGYVEFVGS